MFVNNDYENRGSNTFYDKQTTSTFENMATYRFGTSQEYKFCCRY